MIQAFLKLTLKQKLIWSLACVASLIYLAIEAQGEGDFHIFMAASADLFHGQNIYHTVYGAGFHYLYSLFFAIALYPFTFLPFYIVKLSWLLLNVFLLYRIFTVLFSWLGINQLTNRQRYVFYMLCFGFSARFIHENFHHGQATILMLFFCVQGIYTIFNSRHWWWGSLLIALGINIKILPLVLVPYLLYRGKFKAAMLIVLFDVALWCLPVLFIGVERNQYLLAQWWHMMNPANTGHVLDVSERSFHSLTTLLSTLLVKDVPDAFALPLPRHIANVSLETLHTIINVVRLFLVACCLFFMRTGPFRSARSPLFQFRELAYILALVPLIFPHQQHYAFLFIVPAAMYMWHYLVTHYQVLKKAKRWFLVSGMTIVYLCCNLKLILGEFNPYYEHYKILTYGALLLLILLATAPPKDDALSAPPAS